MYVHAYQSYVWNAIVSERIRLYGAERPVVGDLVFESESDSQNSDPEYEPDEAFEPGALILTSFLMNGLNESSQSQQLLLRKDLENHGLLRV